LRRTLQCHDVTAVEHLEARARQAELAARDRERCARAALPELLRLLVDRYGARRVTLIGSLAEGRFAQRSDVDLLVEGLTLDQMLRAWNEASDLAGLPIDLVRAETVTPGWLAYHERYGKVLHGS